LQPDLEHHHESPSFILFFGWGWIVAKIHSVGKKSKQYLARRMYAINSGVRRLQLRPYMHGRIIHTCRAQLMPREHDQMASHGSRLGICLCRRRRLRSTVMSLTGFARTAVFLLQLYESNCSIVKHRVQNGIMLTAPLSLLLRISQWNQVRGHGMSALRDPQKV
jgi:hypothetical protein